MVLLDKMGNVKSLIKRSRIQSLSSITLSYLLNHRDVHFTKEEIEEWYQEYQSSLDEGVTSLTVNVFRKVYDRVFIGDASTFARHLFRSFDLNGDGYVDFQEFIIGLCVSESRNPDKKVRWAFKMYDIDGNEKISRNEMVTILQAIHEMTHALTGGELGGPEEITDSFFTRFDLDRDGQISFEEFRYGVLNDPLVIHLLECDPHPDR